jgi:osmotically-inducible protein OsmY
LIGVWREFDETMSQTDAEIDRAVCHSLDWDFFVPDGWVRATVSGGVVTLKGRVEFPREWGAIRRALAKIRGVKEIRLPQDLEDELLCAE